VCVCVCVYVYMSSYAGHAFHCIKNPRRCGRHSDTSRKKKTVRERTSQEKESWGGVACVWGGGREGHAHTWHAMASREGAAHG
jgi:hypothetical protein